MTELKQIAWKARVLTRVIPRIKSLASDVRSNEAGLSELIDTVNALLLPKGWVGIDADGMLHVTYVAREDERQNVKLLTNPFFTGPTALAYSADFIWEYSIVNRTVTCVKARRSFKTGQVLPVK